MANSSKTQKPSSQLTPAETSAGMQTALQDNSRFIRTMAKDMAALSGSKIPVNDPKVEESTEEKSEFVGGVALPVHERPYFERQVPRSERELPPQEIVNLPDMEEASSIVSTEPLEPIPAIATPFEADIPFTPPLASTSVLPEREAVLARLRKKVEEEGDMSIEAAPVLTTNLQPQDAQLLEDNEPVWPTEAVIPPAPETISAPPQYNADAIRNSFAFPEIPTTPSQAPQSLEPYREPITEEETPRNFAPVPNAPQSLQTYSGDFSDRIDRDGASAFSVLAREQDAGAPAPESLTPERRNVVRDLAPIFGGILFLGLGIAGAYGAYQLVMTVKETPFVTLSVPSIVRADEQRELTGVGSTLVDALASVANTTLVPGNVLVTYILTTGDDGNGGIIARPATGDVFIRTLQIPAPDILLRNIATQSTVGIVHAGQETRPFFALRVDSYERTYAGMLTWEPLMFDNLSKLFPLHRAFVENTVNLEPSEVDLTLGSTSATSTESIATSSEPVVPTQNLPQGTPRSRFEDAIVENRDVRVLKDTNGQTLVLYGYADKRTLLIARDEAAFTTLLNRLVSE